MASTLIRVGHKGADLLSPGNTRESFRAALDCGVDMIEFDVLRLADSRLVLAHDYHDAAGRDPLTLEEGLDLFAEEAYSGVDLDVDLKLPGYEREVVDGLTKRGLDSQSLISSMYRESLQRIGELKPGLRRGWSVPKVKRDYTKSVVWALPAYGALQVMRARMPGQAAQALRAGQCEALMVNRYLMSQRLAEQVHDAGGVLYVWTVDDAAEILRFEEMGADAVITNDPRLFRA
ncbi:MAG: glycerophosphodiester phosphodiesterase [Thermoleophilaceae bacterium]